MATPDPSLYQGGHDGRFDSLFGTELDGGLLVQMVGESGARQSAAYEIFSLHYGFNRGKQLIVSIRLDYVTMPITESYTRHIYINLLSQEEYFGIWSDFANLSSGFNPIQFW